MRLQNMQNNSLRPIRLVAAVMILQIQRPTFGNMRANGVRTLAAWCLGIGCNHREAYLCSC